MLVVWVARALSDVRAWIASAMNTMTLIVGVILSGCLRVAAVFACNGPPPPSIQDALEAAQMVIVAEVISTEQQPASADPSGRFVREAATFRILQVFKGVRRKGDVIHVISDVGPGACGLSAKNHPVSIESVGKDGQIDAPVLSGRWLIYGNGTEPFELNRHSRTKPMEFGGDAEVRELRRLLKRSAVGHNATFAI
jgi:hypothetical protein